VALKIVTVVGARPQFVKAATVSRVCQRVGIHEVLVHTGQHFDTNMSDVFFKEMEIPEPDYHLDVHGVGHGAMTGRMLEKIEEVLIREKPQFVLVYGDTNSTLAGALAAAKLHIPIAHVEAGLRSFDLHMPEEVNRILTDRISKFLFCPTKTSIANLNKEGFQHFPCQLEHVGDVMFDAVRHYLEKAKQQASILKTAGLQQPFFLATLHRAENTDQVERLRAIVEALNELHRDHPVVLPLHPRTRQQLAQHQIPLHVTTLEPVGYFHMLQLLDACDAVLTDSGGLQKEAYFFQKPCITLRDQTEWVELVEAGVNTIAGADKSKIVGAAHALSSRKLDFSKALYGDGHAAEKIVSILHDNR
jgi:UDP-GlcNAc3NAcA epimerase